MNLDSVGLGGLVISDFTAWVGWLATIMLTVNFALGILQPLRYDPTTRWPRRKLPASLFKLHKWIGYSALGVVIAHPLFLLGHPKTPFSLSAIYLPFTAPAETLLAGIGTIAFYLLLMIVGTSFLRLTLGLKLWKQIHYASYALLPTFLVHGLFVNSSLNEAVPIDYFDTGKFIVEACAVLSVALVVWRLVYHRRSRRMDMPTKTSDHVDLLGIDQPLWSGRLTLTEIFDETPTIRTFRFKTKTGDAIPFTFKAGQYIRLAGIRNYTISSPPVERNYIEVTTKRENDGFFSQYMHDNLRIGDTIAARGPFGRFTFTGEEAKSVVLIAGGVGVTPFLAIIRHLIATKWQGDITLLYSVRRANDVVGAEGLTALAEAHPNLKVHLFFSQEGPQGSNYPVGRMTALALRERMLTIEAPRIYVCGPVAMMWSVTEMLHGHGVSPGSIFVESFGGAMASPKPQALPAAEMAADQGSCARS